MAPKLPNPFAWKSNHKQKHLHLDGEIGGQRGILKFTDEDLKYVFEPEDASGYMKIKSSENNLYLKGVQSRTDETLLIVAAAAKGDEDSTSFELHSYNSTNNTQVSFRLRHVKTNLYLRPHQVTGGSDAVLCAVNTEPDPGNVDLFTAIERP